MVKMEIENLTQEQLKVILESLGYTLLFRKEILMNRTLEEDPKMNKFRSQFRNLFLIFPYAFTLFIAQSHLLTKNTVFLKVIDSGITSRKDFDITSSN